VEACIFSVAMLYYTMKARTNIPRKSSASIVVRINFESMGNAYEIGPVYGTKHGMRKRVRAVRSMVDATSR
jgi:hypothetical protein